MAERTVNRMILLKLDSDHRYADSKLPVTDNIRHLRLTSVQTKEHIRVTRRSIELRVFSDTTVHPKVKPLPPSLYWLRL
jgi:hypothetical protein